MSARILIATPTYDGQVAANYLHSVVDLLEVGRRRDDVAFELATTRATYLHEVRNAFASRVLDDPSFTHLLFVDADMGFSPGLIAKLLAFGAPCVGCYYPRRTTDWPLLAQVLRKRPDQADYREVAASYIGDPLPDAEGRLTARGEFLRAEHLGTGVMLIQRSVFETIRGACPELWVDGVPERLASQHPGLRSGILQAFNPMPSASGLLMGEDVSFCRRWTGLGGELWGCFTERVSHYGHEMYWGDFSARLAAQGLGRKRS